VARILISDNTQQLRLALRLVLEYAGHHVVEASDPAETLTLCDANRPDLLMCDLPGDDGLAAIREIRRRGLCGKIIVMSSAKTAKSHGADAALTKPFHIREAMGAVERLLATRTAPKPAQSPI
jgi:DNA-binding response OmpR family regulator